MCLFFLREFVHALYQGPLKSQFEEVLGAKLNIIMFQNLDKDDSRSIDFPEFESCNKPFFSYLNLK